MKPETIQVQQTATALLAAFSWTQDHRALTGELRLRLED